MRVILVSPNSDLIENDKTFRQRFLTPIIPLGLGYIAAILEKSSIEVVIIDQVALDINRRELVKKILSLRPQIVGFSCLTSVMNNVRQIASDIRHADKNVKIVLGNIHPTVLPEESLKDGLADIVVRGEGEITMLELVRALKEKNNLRAVEGISFRENGSICHNPDRRPTEDLDVLPYPAMHLFDLTKYTEVPLASIYGEVASSISGSRGCPHKCIFCSQDKIHKKPRYRTMKNIVDELEFMNKNFGITCFGFSDPFFPFSFETGMEFCEEMLRTGLHKKIKWVTETRVDMVNLELLKNMKKAGAHLIMYGFEVGNQQVLNRSNKNARIDQAKSAMRDTKKAGIMSLGLFMLGLPGETIDTCKQTIEFAKELDTDFVKFNIAIPYPGSQLFEEYRTGQNMDKEFEKFNSWYDWFSPSGELAYTPDGMTSEELKNLQRKAMFSFYVRPKIIINNILKKRISLKFLFYGAKILLNGYYRYIIDSLGKKLLRQKPGHKRPAKERGGR